MKKLVRELLLDGFGPPDELDVQGVGSRAERRGDPFDLNPGGVVAPHRVHGDADHRQASSTSTCFLPR